MKTAEQQREYFRAYDASRSDDPIYRAKKAAKGRAAYLRLRADPDKYAAFAQASAARARKRRAAINGNARAWISLHLRSVKIRARCRDLEFSITEDDLALPETCPVFGWVLNYGSFQNDPRGASIDRKDNSKGYVPGNVRIVCWRANDLRSNCDDPALFDALAADARSLLGD